MSEGLVELVVESVRVHMLSSQHVVILKQSDRDRYLPIWIGPWEANAIAMRLQGLAPDRPLTHDLFATTLQELGITIQQVVIADLADDTFHARLFLEANGRTIEVDSRPSDALALAVRAGARIYAADAVMARAAVVPDARSREAISLTGDPGTALVDPRLDVFRDFINSLGVDAEGEHREGPAPEERA